MTSSLTLVPLCLRDGRTGTPVQCDVLPTAEGLIQATQCYRAGV